MNKKRKEKTGQKRKKITTHKKYRKYLKGSTQESKGREEGQERKEIIEIKEIKHRTLTENKGISYKRSKHKHKRKKSKEQQELNKDKRKIKSTELKTNK